MYFLAFNKMHILIHKINIDKSVLGVTSINYTTACEN